MSHSAGRRRTKWSLTWIVGIIVGVSLVWSAIDAPDAALTLLGFLVLVVVLLAARFVPALRRWQAEERRARRQFRQSDDRTVVPAPCTACGEGMVLKIIDAKGDDVSRRGEVGNVVCSNCGQPAGGPAPRR